MHKQRGGIELILLILVILIASFLVGGFFKIKITPPAQTNPLTGGAGGQNPASLCCDSGNGADCKVQKGTDQTFTLKFNNQQYGLLKSNIILEEGGSHLKDSGQKLTTGEPIILNSSDGFKYLSTSANECSDSAHDSIWNQKFTGAWDRNYCLSILNDEIVYVCKKNCKTSACYYQDGSLAPTSGPNHSGYYCYGDTSSVYDVYFRINDERTPGIPEQIKNCTAANTTSNLPAPIITQKIVFKQGPKSENIQLNTFGVVQEVSIPSGTTAFLSPFCKPAIYLYPTEKTQVSVKIAPVGPVTLTIPQYPINGWNVTAYPNGRIESLDGVFPYLYYEAQIPDNLLTKEKTGYVVEYDNLKSVFETLLPKLGLNEKEKTEFSDYWLKALPNSPFYFVGVVSTKTLDSVSPLSIFPKPQTVIRVGLYFEPLTEKIAVKEPVFSNIKRYGFTVVEWGGLFKREKNSNFTCIM